MFLKFLRTELYWKACQERSYFRFRFGSTWVVFITLYRCAAKKTPNILPSDLIVIFFQTRLLRNPWYVTYLQLNHCMCATLNRESFCRSFSIFLIDFQTFWRQIPFKLLIFSHYLVNFFLQKIVLFRTLVRKVGRVALQEIWGVSSKNYDNPQFIFNYDLRFWTDQTIY